MNRISQTLRFSAMLLVSAFASITTGCAETKAPNQLPQTVTTGEYGYSGDIAKTRSSINYVRLEPFGFVVEKPFPIIYFSSGHIEAQNFSIESDVIMNEGDLNKVFEISQNFECIQEPETHPIGSKVLEVITHRAFDRTTKCYISIPEACGYVKDIWSFEYEHVAKSEFFELEELSRRIGCPDAPPRQ